MILLKAIGRIMICINKIDAESILYPLFLSTIVTLYYIVSIMFFQQPFQIRLLIKYLPCKLRIGNNSLVPIVLQGARADIQPLTHFLTCKEMLTAKQRFVCLCHFLHPFTYATEGRQHYQHIVRIHVQVSYLFHIFLSLFVILRFVCFRFLRFGLEQ